MVLFVEESGEGRFSFGVEVGGWVWSGGKCGQFHDVVPVFPLEIVSVHRVYHLKFA